MNTDNPTTPIDETGQTLTLSIKLSVDNSQAWIARPSGSDVPPTPTAEQILSLLTDTQVKITDDVRGRIEQYLALFEAAPAAEDESCEPADEAELAESANEASAPPREIPERFLIAEGRPPTEPQDAHFEWHDQFQEQRTDWQGDAAVNYYDVQAITIFEAGTAIGRIVPAKAGAGGVDVLGRFVKPTRKPLDMKIGKGLRVSGDNKDELVTEAGGRVIIEGRNIFIAETLDIGGDVDFHSGSVDACIDVGVRDTIRSNFTVKTTKSLTVGGGIEAATIDVGADLTVRGGIVAHGEGRVKVLGTTTIKFADEADIVAEGDIKVAKAIINSRVQTNGKLVIDHGMIIGGQTCARCGISAGTLGSDADVATTVIIGLHPDIVVQVGRTEEEIVEHKQAGQKIRSMVEPLMANLKRLTATQREKATELMCKADEIDMAVEDLGKRRDELIAASLPGERPSVRIAKLIHPGVRIQIGARQVILKQAIKGPLRIEERKVENATEIVAIDQISGSLTVLPTEDLSFKPPKEDAP